VRLLFLLLFLLLLLLLLLLLWCCTAVDAAARWHRCRAVMPDASRGHVRQAAHGGAGRLHCCCCRCCCCGIVVALWKGVLQLCIMIGTSTRVLRPVVRLCARHTRVAPAGACYTALRLVLHALRCAAVLVGLWTAGHGVTTHPLRPLRAT
jgi:hypothetical protein